MDTIGMHGLELSGYSFLDPALLSTFVERWHGKTSSFHMLSGEMTVTLDDVQCLLNPPIKGRVLDHKGIPTKTEGVDLMIKHMGSTREEAEHEVKTTKGAHARFVYLKELLEKHTTVVNKVEVDGDKDTFERFGLGSHICMAWGTAALTFLYQELTNGIVPSCKYVAGYMTLLQVWIYDYFVDTGGSLDTQYEQQYPQATKYDPTKGQSIHMSMEKMMDRLLPYDITWTPYKDHRDVCPFEDIALYSGWIRCGPIKVRYLPELVLQQFGYVQTIPRHPDSAANILDTPMPVESDVAMLGRLASIRDILDGVMHSDEVPNSSRVYAELQSAYTLTFVPNQGGPGSSSQH
ncbi:protein MAINTENANCE OF MERISTEMS-like [Trifolium pratense]|uniref:protein MAINTENANCE OF MERISTEMS-like n=1 Tax=Trifolium pratense TaxID=57577 RepID=UPI001E694EDA|nr:protein MAINTENANCE OF MERISTEMS-like [Trifolium pratense]